MEKGRDAVAALEHGLLRAPQRPVVAPVRRTTAIVARHHDDRVVLCVRWLLPMIRIGQPVVPVRVCDFVVGEGWSIGLNPARLKHGTE